MSVEPRAEVKQLREEVHGAAIPDAPLLRTSKVGVASPWLDFSTNTNPFGPSPSVMSTLEHVDISRYPDRDATALRLALAQMLSVDQQRVLPTSGVTELLYLIALAYLRPGDQLIIVGPTYTEYQRVAKLMGANVVECHATKETQFAVPLDELAAQIGLLAPRAIFICNPNNPTGQLAATPELLALIELNPWTLFVVDEAYIDFVAGAKSFVGFAYDNLLVMRSLTKAHALAGVRLGFAVASAEVIEILSRVRPPWSVSQVAQAAGVAALRDLQHVERTLGALKIEKEFLVSELRRSGAIVLDAATHFFLVQVTAASECTRILHEQSLIVRDGTSFGLPNYIRISPLDRTSNERLVSVLRSAGQVARTQ